MGALCWPGWPSALGHLSSVAVISFLKLLCLKLYRSTDFEVHRFWLALTATQPLEQWYSNSASIWTLDYPPLFAWFEYALAQLSRWVPLDLRGMLELEQAGHLGVMDNVVLFQRLTVIIGDVVLYAAVVYFMKKGVGEPLKSVAVFAVCLHPGLLIVDHVHFQYNGMLIGLMVLAMALLLDQRYVAGTLVFAVLLNMKHIFLYSALPFLVFMLRVLAHTQPASQAVWLFSALSAVTLAVFVVSFGPFLYHGVLSDVIARMFPFGDRGLCHSYWAPNMWALTNVLDKGLALGLKRVMGYDPGMGMTNTMTSGVLGRIEYSVLPQITPAVCAGLTLALMVPLVLRLTLASPGLPARHRLELGVTMATFTSFMFGWHVHEKAVLMVLVPGLLFYAEGGQELQAVGMPVSMLHSIAAANVVGVYSLFPLLFTFPETLLAPLLLVLWVVLLQPVHRSQTGGVSCPTHVRLYLWGLAPLFVVTNVLLPFVAQEKLAFMPLLLTSVYCAVGMAYVYAHLYMCLWHASSSSSNRSSRVSSVTPKED
jgi:alpha-1,3-glucosyltransferase